MIDITYDAAGIPAAELNARLFVLGELIIAEVRRYIRRFGLVESGSYLQNWYASVNNGVLTISHREEYALFLEFGTYEFGQSYDKNSFPIDPPKKSDLPAGVIESLPKGMAPFAPLRRVLYDVRLMNNLRSQVFG